MSPLLLLLVMLAAAPPASDERAQERERMVLSTANLAVVGGGGAVRRIDRNILDAMRLVPRHLLVPQAVRADAYRNVALPIGHQATISQPAVVALMTQLLEPEADHVVLEVGTGSGYQAAILSRLVRQVYSIEIVAPLAERAARDLAALGYINVTIRAGDGYDGWPERAPFDRIIITAGADHVPRPLLDQLRPGGVLVMPLGRTGQEQQLTVVRKSRTGRISQRRIAPALFVPLTREPTSP